MRDIVLAVITRLKADSPVAAVVGARIYRSTLPLSPTFPAITVSRVDKARDPISSSTGRYEDARVQCTAWSGTSDAEAENLAELIADSLNRVVNSYLSTGTTTGVNVVSIADAGGVPDVNSDIPLYMEHRDFRIRYSYK